MKKILMSVMVIGIAAAMLGAGTFSYFSDTEKSVGNTFTAGTIDIAVDDGNPWSATYQYEMKPCDTVWIKYNIKNVGTNDAEIWKHLVLVDWDGGAKVYPIDVPVASSEPEWEEGGGASYVERDFLPAWIICDLKVNGQWIFKESNNIRLDDLTCTWVYLGTLAKGQTMTVEQSYHLMTWKDSNIPEVTNWAQGDVVTFDIELYAVQTVGDAPGPLGYEQTLTLENKDQTYDLWEPLTGDAIVGTLTFKTASNEFEYTFSAAGLKTSTDYDLIYYADPWPGSGGTLIKTFTTDGSGDIPSTPGSVDLGMDIPVGSDWNAPAGGKIWLVLSSDYDGTKMIAWQPADYLFGMNLIYYDDTNVP